MKTYKRKWAPTEPPPARPNGLEEPRTEASGGQRRAEEKETERRTGRPEDHE